MRVFLAVLLSGCLLAALPARASEPDPGEFSTLFLDPVLTLEEKRMESFTVDSRARIQLAQWDAVQAVAREIAGAYFSGRWKPDYFWQWMRWCERGRALRLVTCLDLDHAVIVTFFEHGIMTLRQSKSPRLRELARRVDASSPTSFLRLRFDQVPSDEWFVFFAHELVERIDPQRQRAITESRELGRRLFVPAPRQAGDRFTRRIDLSESRPARRRWLLAGLGRGLLAEWRAWTVAFSLFREAAELGEIPRSKRLDKLLAGVASADLPDFTFSLLDPRYGDPQDSIFGYGVLSDELEVIREDLRTGHEPRSLNGLESLLP